VAAGRHRERSEATQGSATTVIVARHWIASLRSQTPTAAFHPFS
jgi:hypothetical protein